jgi:hypothetical protein
MPKDPYRLVRVCGKVYGEHVCNLGQEHPSKCHCHCGEEWTLTSGLF